MGGTGLEPVTSCVSSRRSNRAELTALWVVHIIWLNKTKSQELFNFCCSVGGFMDVIPYKR
jgi:hypothetical protein